MSATCKYEVVEHWGLGPRGRPMGGVVPAVAADSRGRVFVGRRHPPALLVYDRGGAYLDTWGAGLLKNPHLLWVDSEDRVYAADTDDHTIRCFSPQGEVVRTWGTPGVPGASGQPFNQPTKAMRGPSGDLYVSDGYGQHRIHRFSEAGELLHSWGSEGTGPGQFALPHSLWVDRHERVWAVDRENNRIQRFDSEGRCLDEWTDLVMPMDLFITPTIRCTSSRLTRGSASSTWRSGCWPAGARTARRRDNSPTRRTASGWTTKARSTSVK